MTYLKVDDTFNRIHYTEVADGIEALLVHHGIEHRFMNVRVWVSIKDESLQELRYVRVLHAFGATLCVYNMVTKQKPSLHPVEIQIRV